MALTEFGHVLGVALARIVMTVLDFAVLVRFAFFVKGRRDPLGVAGLSGSHWLPH